MRRRGPSFILRCLDGCGRIGGHFPTRRAATQRWAQHLAVPVQGTHRGRIEPPTTTVDTGQGPCYK